VSTSLVIAHDMTIDLATRVLSSHVPPTLTFAVVGRRFQRAEVATR
jgi:hypothetical protein